MNPDEKLDNIREHLAWVYRDPDACHHEVAYVRDVEYLLDRVEINERIIRDLIYGTLKDMGTALTALKGTDYKAAMDRVWTRIRTYQQQFPEEDV